MRELLGRIAPGTALRDGLERILPGRTGALIVLGYDQVVESLCTGGFALDVEFSATRLRELAKMDGAVIVSNDGTRIVRAGVHLMPDPTIPTEESGTRHRTAERVADADRLPGDLGQPVDAHHRRVRRRPPVHARGPGDDPGPGQPGAGHPGALQAPPRRGGQHPVRAGDRGPGHRPRRDERRQRLEMVRRIADEIEGYVVELGTDGRLLALQLDEMLAGVEEDRGLLVRDYLPAGGRKRAPSSRCSPTCGRCRRPSCSTCPRWPRCYGLPTSPDALDSPVSPRGYRLLARVPRLPGAIIDRLVDHFGGLQKLLAATVEDLQAVEGVGEARARGVREGLSRLAEASILDRYS